MTMTRSSLLLTGALLPALACSGQISTDTPGTTTPDLSGNSSAICASTSLGPTPLRRLTRAQYDNTVRDLLGIAMAPSAQTSFPADTKEGPFDINAGAVGEVLVEDFLTLAEQIAALVAKDAKKFAGCAANDAGSDACAGSFAVRLGSRAFRRPLTSEEIAALERLYIGGKQRGGFATGIEMMVRHLLAAPDFMYHVSLGAGSAQPGTTLVPLTGYEIASRLSYFLWNSMPDEALFDAATTGKLTTRAGVRAEAQRMLKDARAAQGIGAFFVQWLGADRLEEAPKDTQLYPQFTPQLRDAMRTETGAFGDYVIRKGDGKLETLLTAPYSVSVPGLQAVYGMHASKSQDGVMVTQFPAQSRAGILTHASFLAVEAHRDQTSPVKRGVFLRTQLLCQELAAPPGDVNNAPPEVSAGTTARERFAQHSSDPKCAGCHSAIDPLGLGLEHYDAIGAQRQTEGGKPVDASGALTGTSNDGAYYGAPELARRLAGTKEVAACMTRQWFRFALGRLDTQADSCAIQQIARPFMQAGGDLRELILSLVTSDAFLFRQAE